MCIWWEPYEFVLFHRFRSGNTLIVGTVLLWIPFRMIIESSVEPSATCVSYRIDRIKFDVLHVRLLLSIRKRLGNMWSKLWFVSSTFMCIEWTHTKNQKRNKPTNYCELLFQKNRIPVCRWISRMTESCSTFWPYSHIIVCLQWILIFVSPISDQMAT